MDEQTSALISALALFMAEQSGIMEDIPLKEIGILAGVIASATSIIKRFVNDEMGKEQTTEILKDIVSKALDIITSTLLDLGHNKLTAHIEQQFGEIGSIISNLISGIYNQYKDTLIEKTKNFAKNILKNHA